MGEGCSNFLALKYLSFYSETALQPWGVRVLPHIDYIGMCGPKGYGFSAVLVVNRVSISADFGHFGHK